MKYSVKELLDLCVEQANLSRCKRSSCGAIIISSTDQVIGYGQNSPAGNENPRCDVKKSVYDNKVTDKTCCVHAEQRAIMVAIKNISDLTGSILYFIRLDEDGSPKISRNPYCTICSKMALDVGIKYFALFHDLENPTLYDTQDYNNMSYEYKK